MSHGRELYQEHLADKERPIALNTATLANINRDSKKQKKAFSYQNFCFYVKKDDKDLPEGRYGATALLMQEAGLFPSWALFCFTELANGAAPGYKPETMALFSDDCLLIDPTVVGETVTGFLIAQESASNKMRVMKDEKGNVYNVLMPNVGTKIIAEEDVTLHLRGCHVAK